MSVVTELPVRINAGLSFLASERATYGTHILKNAFLRVLSGILCVGLLCAGTGCLPGLRSVTRHVARRQGTQTALPGAFRLHAVRCVGIFLPFCSLGSP